MVWQAICYTLCKLREDSLVGRHVLRRLVTSEPMNASLVRHRGFFGRVERRLPARLQFHNPLQATSTCPTIVFQFRRICNKASENQLTMHGVRKKVHSHLGIEPQWSSTRARGAYAAWKVCGIALANKVRVCGCRRNQPETQRLHRNMATDEWRGCRQYGHWPGLPLPLEAPSGPLSGVRAWWFYK